MPAKLRALLATIRRHVNPLIALGLVGIVAGALMLWLGNGKGLLQAIGGAILGAGLTVLITATTSSQAVHEQYAKEANLRRRDEVYGPLHAELKSLREELERARNKEDDMPLYISIAGEMSRRSYLPVGYEIPALAHWPEYKSDYRLADFSPPTRALLDDILIRAKDYNDAVEPTREPAIDVLAKQVKAAIIATRNSEEFKNWLTEREYPDYRISLTSTPDPREWFRRLLESAPADRTLWRAWAAPWIEAWPVQHQPVTLGWLLAGQPQEAARFVHKGYSFGAGDTPPPALEWIASIFEAAWPAFSKHPSYLAFHAAEDALFHTLRRAEAKLDEALQFIQDRYEGGKPPI